MAKNGFKNEQKRENFYYLLKNGRFDHRVRLIKFSIIKCFHRH